MGYFFVVVAFLAILSLVCADCQFSVSEPEGIYFYNLEGLKWSNSNYQFGYNMFFNNTEEWIFNVCDSVDGIPNNFVGGSYTCAPDSIACFQYVGYELNPWISAGKAQNPVFSKSIYGSDKGVGVTYSNGDFCSFTTRTVRFEFVCSTYDYPTITNIEHLDCYDILTVNTSYACPSIASAPDIPEPSITVEINPVYPHESSRFKLRLVVVIVVGLVILMSCICCLFRCIRRQHRMNNQKAFELTNTFTYQPVPQENSMQPQHYPVQYVQHPIQVPQYVFYQPPAPKPAIESRDAQIISDEQLAKQLQAQLNRE